MELTLPRFGLLKDQLTDFPGFMLGIKVSCQ